MCGVTVPYFNGRNKIIEVIENQKKEIPFWLKINLTVKEAAEYSNIGETTIRKLLEMRGCSFVLKIGSKSLVKRKEFEKFLDDKHYL